MQWICHFDLYWHILGNLYVVKSDTVESKNHPKLNTVHRLSPQINRLHNFGHLGSFYLQKSQLGLLKITAFIFLAPLIQISIAKIVQKIRKQLFSNNESTAIVLMECSSAGLLNFTFAFATKDEELTALVGLYVCISIIVTLTYSVHLIQNKEYLSIKNDEN